MYYDYTEAISENSLVAINRGYFMREPVPQVLLEIRDGHALGMADAAHLVPGTKGGTANASTIFRWCSDGVRLRNGQRLKLESVRVGKRVMTSGPALERFIMATTESYNTDPEPVRTPTARQRASEKATKELKAIGC